MTKCSLRGCAIHPPATADALLNMLIAASMFAAWLHLETAKRVWSYATFASIGLGFLAKGPVAILIPFAVTFAFCFLRRDLRIWARAVFDWRGLLLFAACLWGFLRLAIRGTRAGAEVAPAYRSYCLGMIGFLGAFLACNMFYANFHKELVMGTVAWHLGMLAAAGSLASSSRASVGHEGTDEAPLNAEVVAGS